MPTVEVTAEMLKHLLTHAKRADTVEAWAGIALAWIESAETEMTRLRDAAKGL